MIFGKFYPETNNGKIKLNNSVDKKTGKIHENNFKLYNNTYNFKLRI